MSIGRKVYFKLLSLKKKGVKMKKDCCRNRRSEKAIDAEVHAPSKCEARKIESELIALLEDAKGLKGVQAAIVAAVECSPDDPAEYNNAMALVASMLGDHVHKLDDCYNDYVKTYIK